MTQMIWPVLVVIAANTMYHICSKSTPANVQPFASLTVTYLVAACLSAILFFITSRDKNLLAAAANLNWASLLLGCAIVALEFGYLSIYRAGWNISTGSLVANIGLACVLLLVGVLFYQERIQWREAFGFLLCLGGIVLINR